MPATAAQKAWRDRNIEKVREHDRARQRARRASWSEEQKQRHRDAVRRYWHGKGKYARRGITKEAYDEMLQAQGDECKTCSRPAGESRGGLLCIDHDHRTGRVRGLLCHNCNVILGLAADRPEVLERLIAHVLYEEDA